MVIRADGWQDAGVPARVTVSRCQMGRKTVRTGDPADKGDRDVLEVLVDLDRQDPRLVDRPARDRAVPEGRGAGRRFDPSARALTGRRVHTRLHLDRHAV